MNGRRGDRSEPSCRAIRSPTLAKIWRVTSMYCPRCSQEQGAGEMRFCSRCGFPLTTLTQLVANGGILKGFDIEVKPQLSRRQKGIRWGALLMIISGVLVPGVALLSAIEGDLAVLFVPVLLVFFTGLFRLLYAYLLQPSPPAPNQIPSTAALNAPAHRAGLPAHQSVPISTWRQPIDTSEMTQPASVTDHTTKLLQDELEPK